MPASHLNDGGLLSGGRQHNRTGGCSIEGWQGSGQRAHRARRGGLDLALDVQPKAAVLLPHLLHIRSCAKINLTGLPSTSIERLLAYRISGHACQAEPRDQTCQVRLVVCTELNRPIDARLHQ